ncbi:MAG: YeeE/YedE family protein [Methylococcaceae bacterium]|nr:YeeE/YedE family protein [Methylococcaceae bacterium]
MENFTPISALAGGILIGIAVTLLLLFNGRIAGVSGILFGTAFPRSGDWLWRFLFVIGLVAGAAAYHHFVPDSFSPRSGYPVALLTSGGMLVGFGTRMGGGCTSGHGICGISRFSPRSVIATGVFMVCGAITVYLVRHVAGIG